VEEEENSRKKGKGGKYGGWISYGLIVNMRWEGIVFLVFQFGIIENMKVKKILRTFHVVINNYGDFGWVFGKKKKSFLDEFFSNNMEFFKCQNIPRLSNLIVNPIAIYFSIVFFFCFIH